MITTHLHTGRKIGVQIQEGGMGTPLRRPPKSSLIPALSKSTLWNTYLSHATACTKKLERK